MATITVYPYTIYNPKNKSHGLAKGMCTEDVISKIKDSKAIRESAINIDDSELTQSGRYYAPSQEETKE
jgi:hypothetical protein